MSGNKSDWRRQPGNRERENALRADRRAAKAREKNPNLPPWEPRAKPYTPRTPKGDDLPPRGPLGDVPEPILSEGLELGGQSIRRDANGEIATVWDLGRRAGDPNASPPPPDFALTGLSRMTRRGAEVIRWESFDREKAAQWAAFEAAVASLVASAEGRADPIDDPILPIESGSLHTVIAIGDPHAGLLAWAPETGEDFDLKIWARELGRCLSLLIDAAPVSDTVTIANLGDLFHAQDDMQRTPQSGHKLDVDSRHAKIFEAALMLIRIAIDLALRRFGRVKVVNIPGNHDPNAAFMVSAFLGAWYRNEPRVEVVPGTNQFVYEEHGLNLIGYCHGPGAGQRHERLPGVMATDQAEAWGRTKFRVWHTGDVHHLSRKEYPGCVVETHRTMAAKDVWHYKSGYRSGQSLESITYHRAFGEITRNTVSLARVRDSLETGSDRT